MSTDWIMPKLDHFWEMHLPSQVTEIAEYALSMADGALRMREEYRRARNQAGADGAAMAAEAMLDRAAKTINIANHISRTLVGQDSKAGKDYHNQVRKLSKRTEDLVKKNRRNAIPREDGAHRWYADSCHRLLRGTQFIPRAKKFLNDQASGAGMTEDRLQETAQTLQQMATWPTDDVYDRGSYHPGKEPDPRAAERVQGTDEEVSTLTQEILTAYNDRLTTEVSTMVKIAPELEARLRRTLFPAAGAIVGFEYAKANMNSQAARALAKHQVVDPLMRAVTRPQGELSFSISWIGFIWNGRRMAKGLPEAYPVDFPAMAASQHAHLAKASLMDTMAPGENERNPQKEPFARMCFALEEAVGNNVHTLGANAIGRLDHAATMEALNTGQRHMMFREMIEGNLNLLAYLSYNSTRDSVTSWPLAEREGPLMGQDTAKRLEDVARQAGFPERMVQGITRLT